MRMPLTWPLPEIGYCLRGRGSVETTTHVLGTNHAEDFDVDNLGRRLIGFGREPSRNLGCPTGISHDLEEARRVNDEHRATRRARRPDQPIRPRC